MIKRPLVLPAPEGPAPARHILLAIESFRGRRGTAAADRLRRAPLEHGFREVAALVGRHIETQEVEEAEELGDDNVVRASVDGPERPEAP
jgi:hypothetical protein